MEFVQDPLVDCLVTKTISPVMANCHQLCGCQATTDAGHLPSWMVTIIRIAKEATNDERNSREARGRSR
ncbi:hypothetical protein TNCV_3186781 [Trichonephila clavipes]|nr:hypothetical protein TNCV_3186781 [Trichonephila clavipes]